jgi:hypothetical protein
MGFMQDSLDSQKIERVRAVVDNEYRQRRDNATIGRALEFMFSAVFPQGHPYHEARKRPTDEESIPLNDLQQLGRTYYIPNNASLALSGDFEPATAVALIDHSAGCADISAHGSEACNRVESTAALQRFGGRACRPTHHQLSRGSLTTPFSARQVSAEQLRESSPTQAH